MAAVDMNVVMTGGGKFVEVQGTAEGLPFDRGRLNEMLDVAGQGLKQLSAAQQRAFEEAGL
jgi:ribonuclease PH